MINQTNLSQYSPLLFILILVGIWIAVTIHFSYMSGWARLSKIYKLSQPFHGRLWRFQSARMAMDGSPTPLVGAIRSALTIGVNQEGLYLSIFILFRLTSPPLFVPWEDILVSSEKGFLYNYMKFKFRRAPSVTLRINERIGRELIEHAKSSFINYNTQHLI